MTPTTEAPRTFFQKLLDFVERAGNKVPHPAVLFFILIALVVVFSQLFHMLGASVAYQRINPETHEIVDMRTGVNSLLTADGIRFVCTSMVPNFINFGPVGIILVAMIGVGLAERAGLIQALIRKIVLIAPRRATTAIIVTLGMVSGIATDAGYLVLIPLGAAAFHGMGRHPLAGLAAAFAAVAATFGVNVLVVPIDGILAEMTNDAIHIVDPNKSISLTSNFYFAIFSSLLLIVVCTLVTERIVEPRMSKYVGDVPPEESQGLSPEELRGLRYALFAFAGMFALLLVMSLPPGAPLRHAETGELLGNSPFMGSIIFMIMSLFLVTGVAYGVGAKTIASVEDGINAITKTFADLGGLLFLFFVIAQFVAYFNYSNMGTIAAIKLANYLKEVDLGSIMLLMGFLLTGFVLSIPIPNIIPKWAIMAPIFVPVFMKLGVAPDVVLAAYRVSDAPPNVS